MPLFRNAHTGRDISGESVELEFRGHLDVALRGLLAGDADGLTVTADDPVLVRVARQPGRRGDPVWRISSTGTPGETEIVAETSAGARQDAFHLRLLDHATRVAEQRAAVVAEAQRHIGCHYLWGAAGAMPGQLNGMPGRPGSVRVVPDRFDPRNPSVHAASCDVDGHHVCAGRYDEAGGVVVRSNDPDLVAYLDEQRDKPADELEDWHGYTPRMVEGYTNTRQIVWGESCLDVRHFDCVGFVNYCYSVALRRSVQIGIPGWITQSVEVTNGTDQPGDILTIDEHHIGLATGDGQVIHASQSSRGVVIDPLRRGWTRRGRFVL